jgi:hypothetical protein
VCELYELGGWARESIAGTNADWNAFVRPTVVVCCTVVSLILRTSAQDASSSRSMQVPCRPENMCQRTSPIAQRLSTIMSSLTTGIYFAKTNINDQLIPRIRTTAWLAYLPGTHNCTLCHHTYIYQPPPPKHEQGLPHTPLPKTVYTATTMSSHICFSPQNSRILHFLAPWCLTDPRPIQYVRRVRCWVFPGHDVTVYTCLICMYSRATCLIYTCVHSRSSFLAECSDMELRFHVFPACMQTCDVRRALVIDR